MSHRILIMSPLHNMGATVVSTLLTQAATFDNKTATLIFTQPNSNLPDYLGIEDINDPTRSIMQIVRLVDNGAISDEDILDYAHQFSKNAYLLNVADPSLSGRDRDQVVTHLAKVMQIPANRLCKVHYNPWITKCCNTRTLGTVVPTARQLDPRVAALNCDFNELMQCINGDMVFKVKKGI